MGVPKRKRSRARRDSRHANKGLKAKAITGCQNCKEPLSTHSACKSCGFYKGVKVLKTKNDRAVKRGQARQEAAARQKAAEAKAAPQEQK